MSHAEMLMQQLHNSNLNHRRARARGSNQFDPSLRAMLQSQLDAIVARDAKRRARRAVIQ